MNKKEIMELSEKDFIEQCETAIYLDSMNSVYNRYTDKAVAIFYKESERRRETSGKSLYSVAYNNLKKQLGF